MSATAASESLIGTTLTAGGLLLATIDMPGRTMNVFSTGLMDALDVLMDRVDGDAAVQCVVLTSGKPSFLAGADLTMVRGYCDVAERMTDAQVFAMCGRLGRQLVRLENSAKPWVAAVNGLALGGGLELTLACRVRVVADEPKIQLGLPEVRLGLLPGAGGTQRLPRLVGFELAIDMLLSGRPIDPQTAVRAGLFDRAVPAATLIDEARATALALRGTAIDLAAKFRHLGQADVPLHSPAVAREIALKQGIAGTDFDRYPAYSAIVDSVLLGARRPLAEATDIEMRHFLRLMFSPVAGNMVRTLFLNRQRADRELAAPEGLRIEQVGVGTISSANAAWNQALGKSKLNVADDAALPADTIELLDNRGMRHRVALRALTDRMTDGSGGGMAGSQTGGGTSLAPSGDERHSALAVLSPTGPFGRVLEIVADDDAVAAALSALAARLYALPWRSRGTGSALMAQADAGRQDADAQAIAALTRAAEADIGDPAFYDVACCIAGVAPAWSGGPFSHLWREHARLASRLDAAQSLAWERVRPILAKGRE